MVISEKYHIYGDYLKFETQSTVKSIWLVNTEKFWGQYITLSSTTFGNEPGGKPQNLEILSFFL